MKLFGKIKQKKIALTLAVLALLLVSSLVPSGIAHAATPTDVDCDVVAMTDNRCTIDTFYATAVVQCLGNDTWSSRSKSCDAYNICNKQGGLFYVGGVGNICPNMWTTRAKYVAANAVTTGDGGNKVVCKTGTALNVATGTCATLNSKCGGSENSGDCTASATCSTGYHTSDGTCVKDSAAGCAIAFHWVDSGGGQCVADSNAAGGCASGYHWTDNGGGMCIADTTTPSDGDNPVATPVPTSDGSDTCSAANSVKCDAESCPLAAGTWDATKKTCTFTSDPAATSGHCSTAQKCDLIMNYVNPFIQFLSALVGVAVTISIVIGGIQYGSSAGDPQRASAAKARIRSSIVALLVFLFLYALINFIVPGGLFS